MCGIVGIYAYGNASAPADPNELIRMRDHMRRRGPDGAGAWSSADQRVALGHRRLAIIDLSERGAQPMQTVDGRLHVTFNGEIYNYRALRAELEHKGYVFQSHSDTEVLLHLYRDRGPEMLRALRGMYAFGLWDAAERSLLLARDPYGIKPLYYSDHGGTLRFASQVKALLAGGQVPREHDTAGLVGFHLWGFVPEPYTRYRAVRALPAGSYLTVKQSGAGEVRSHFSISRQWADACEAPHVNLREQAVQARIRAALRDSVASHMIADVPVSAFLSGGIDSAALVGLMSEHAEAQTQAITLSFSEFAGQSADEAPLAAEVAQFYGLSHHVRHVDRDEFQRDLPTFLSAMDQPTIDGLNTWFVSKATAELGLKVAISGLGGDELFGGYPSFQQVPRFARTLAWPARIPGLGRAFRTATAPWLARALEHTARAHPKLAGTLEYGGSVPGAYFLKRGLFMPWELPSILPEDFVRDGLTQLAANSGHIGHTGHIGIETLLTPTPQRAWAQVAVLETTNYMRNQLLRDTDWASMAHSLEVRVPLVDRVLLETLAPSLAHVRRRTGKLWLARSPVPALPQHIQTRPKTGFTTPIATWLQRAPELDLWRAVPALRAAHCPWARRYAYAIAHIA
jgi:asparagine synthase (glutamine-hydrolysing)